VIDRGGQARAAAIVWTPRRVRALPLAEIARRGPEYSAAVAAAVAPLAELLAGELERRVDRAVDGRPR